MNRIIAFVRSPSDPRARKRSDALAEAMLGKGWSEIVNRRGVRLLAHLSNADLAPITLEGGGGLVLGALFRGEGGEHERIEHIESETVARWCETDGAALTQECWGGYLAIMLGLNDRVLVVRDPAGARPCFVSSADEAGVRVVFTHIEDFASVISLPEVDEHFLALFLAQPRLVTERTGFQGVREVLAGECLVIQDGAIRTPLAWRPPSPNRAMRALSSADLARQLRAVVEGAVSAWSALDAPIVHRLSGGLDSSIALAALMARKRQTNIRCITERPHAFAEGDEVEAARAVARRLGAPLIEACYRPQDLRYEKLREAPLSAKPSVTQLSFSDAIFLGAVEQGSDATLLTSGQGGDQVFYRSNARCLGADAVRAGVSPSEIVGVALNAARASRRSIWPVLAKAVEFGVLREPKHHVRKVLMSAASGDDDAIRNRAVEEAMADEWVRAAARRGPGEMMRALHLADLQYYHGDGLLGRHFILAPVLASQPIIEFCCGIPAYRSVDGGRDRGLARLAFANDLPASAVDRRRKGDTTRFYAAVAEVNGTFMRDVLCGGELERRGLFRSAALEKTTPTAVLDFTHHLVAELWLRKVTEVRSASPVAQGAPALDA